MAKQFYSLEEAQAKLGMTAEEIKQLVRDGQLREFRDGSHIRYKSDDVDGLAKNLASLSGSLGGTSGELILEPADETSMGLTGSDMLTLDEADRTSADSTVTDDQKEDTVITSVGISVFDDEEVPEKADPGAKTVVAQKDKTGSGISVVGLSSSGTGTGSGSGGSGLLDLTRESDDTSLGAELLDEIYTEDQEAGVAEMGEATRAGLEAPTQGQRQPEPTHERPQPVVAQQTLITPIIVRGETGPLDVALGGALVAAVVPLAFAGIAVSGNAQGVLPGLLESIYTRLPIFGGVFLGIVLVGFFVGFFLGKRGVR